MPKQCCSWFIIVSTIFHNSTFCKVSCKLLLASAVATLYLLFVVWLQAVPVAQKTFRVEADSLHLTLVGRFIYDVMHFVTEAREIASVLSVPSTAAAAESQPQQNTSSYRPITEV